MNCKPIEIKVDGYQISLGRKAIAKRGLDRFLVQNQKIDWSKNDILISVVPKNDTGEEESDE